MSGHPEPTKRLDCVGLFCPEPLFQTRTAMDELEVGDTLELLADDPAADEDIHRFAKRTGHAILEFEEKDGVFRFLLRKEK
ncbi:MAG: sulfurtransferase TusA family protein [Promethearchaeota archaeon]